jgi:hypothetical protein
VGDPDSNWRFRVANCADSPLIYIDFFTWGIAIPRGTPENAPISGGWLRYAPDIIGRLTGPFRRLFSRLLGISGCLWT